METRTTETPVTAKTFRLASATESVDFIVVDRLAWCRVSAHGVQGSWQSSSVENMRSMWRSTARKDGVERDSKALDFADAMTALRSLVEGPVYTFTFATEAAFKLLASLGLVKKGRCTHPGHDEGATSYRITAVGETIVGSEKPRTSPCGKILDWDWTPN